MVYYTQDYAYTLNFLILKLGHVWYLCLEFFIPAWLRAYEVGFDITTERHSAKRKHTD